ncbi:hypothetical protein AV545_04155 [Paenibacillus jamilae]|nr:hypothetical protein AV545_04155 [Paenibacillus jamilae]
MNKTVNLLERNECAVTYIEELDEIWNKALKQTPCSCMNDDKWEQDVSGRIKCSRCEQIVTENKTGTLLIEIKRIRK